MSGRKGITSVQVNGHEVAQLKAGYGAWLGQLTWLGITSQSHDSFTWYSLGYSSFLFVRFGTFHFIADGKWGTLTELGIV